MNLIEKVYKKRIWVNIPISIFFIFIFSIIATYVVFISPPNAKYFFEKCYEQTGFILLLLNWLPSFLAMFFIYFLTNSCAFACGITIFIVTVMSIVNNYKIQLRQAPFWPWDIMLSSEAAGISRSFNPEFVTSIIIQLVIMIVAVLLSSFFIRNKKTTFRIRFASIFVGFAFIAISHSTVFRDKKLYNNMYVEGNNYNDVNIYNSKGFLYSFVYNMVNNRIIKPDGYNAKRIQDIEAAYNENIEQIINTFRDKQKPNVIVILGEAFSELALNPELDFSRYLDDYPMKNYQELIDESIHGRIIVPGIGGGTADAEFDILTGITSRHYHSVPYSFSLITKPITSIVSILKNIGYENVAIHPGDKWFYNRMNAYPLMGFSEFTGIEAFDLETQEKGMYINERVTFDHIIDKLENNSTDSPLFLYCVTIQNHGPYVDKYYGTAKNFDTKLPFTKEDLNILYNYFVGVNDSVRELIRLVDYLKSSDEPTVLLYFGDHLPPLSNNIYKLILPDTFDNQLDKATIMYQTPYLIWSNEPAKELITDFNLKEELISPSYLGAILLKLLGFEKADPFFHFLCEMYEKYPAILVSRYARNDGTLIEESTEPNADIKLLRDWEYYRLLE